MFDNRFLTCNINVQQRIYRRTYFIQVRWNRLINYGNVYGIQSYDFDWLTNKLDKLNFWLLLS